MKLISGLAALGAPDCLWRPSRWRPIRPDLVGTWKVTGESYAAIGLGEANERHSEYSDPNFGTPE